MLSLDWLSVAGADGADISERVVSVPQIGFNVNVAYGVMSSSSAFISN